MPTSNVLKMDPADLEALERIITMRLPGTEAECARAARMRVLVRTAGDLARALSTYSRHALVHCQGTAGASDFSVDTAQLCAAMAAFCGEVRDVASEYAPHADEDDRTAVRAAPEPPVPAPEHRPSVLGMPASGSSRPGTGSRAGDARAPGAARELRRAALL